MTAFLLLASLAAQQQGTPTRLEFRVEPNSLRLRPRESAVLQVKVYGKLGDKEGRLRQAGWNANVAPGAGHLSKPFRFQGADSEAFLEPPGSAFANVFRQLTGQFLQKDAVVYHAPAEPGKYKVEATLGTVRGVVELEVAADLPTPTATEKWTFGPETHPPDRYRSLAEHWAPFVAQETWFDWRADALCRSDFDNDTDGANNWDNLGLGSTQAYVYYAAIESESHWFLIYNFFHARDYSDNCVAGTCHENDNEGVILTVRKDGSEKGRLEAMETLAHNNVYSYTADPAIRSGAHNIEANIGFHQDTHPVVFLEAGGHGALGGTDKKSFFDPATRTWRQGTGITYVYKGVAERPRHAMDREVGYELLPIYHHWWLPSQADSHPLFSARYRYAPVGNRPAPKAAIPGSFRGIKHGVDKAKPFWGWHDEATRRRKILATGQWGADPAYAVSRNLTFPADRPVSTTYVFNPYLDINPPDPPAAPLTRNVIAAPN